jgi:nucleoside-diphosphate-sugar epimerase
MAGELILLTGGTGHLGFRTLVEALSQGYRVRAAVRSDAKIAEVKAAKSIQPHLDRLSFTLVPNIEKDGAFDEAVKDVDLIIHLASPLAVPSEDDEANIIRPAIRGTLSILYSALKQPTIKRVVITSSVAAVSPAEPKPFTADNVEPDPVGPYDNAFVAYTASKKLAYNRTRDFIAKENPHFSVSNVMPTFVIGKNELATTPETVNAGSNGIAMMPLLGIHSPSPMPSFVCHVDDVAFVHVAALKPEVKGNRNFGVNYLGDSPVQWDEAIDIVKKHFPKEVEKGVFPLGGSVPSLPTHFDASKTEQTFGIKFKNYEEAVVNLAGHYAEVVAAQA